jgi:hypothetical protein
MGLLPLIALWIIEVFGPLLRITKAMLMGKGRLRIR